MKRCLIIFIDLLLGFSALATTRPTGYGAVPGYRPVAYGNGVDLAQSCVFLGREVDVTGYHHFGERDFDPVSGQWLEQDRHWNPGDPNGQSFCGGDPIDHNDSDGRLATGFYAGLTDAPVPANASSSFMAGYTGGGVAGSYYGTLLGEGETAVIPSTYINGAKSFGNNINTVYQSDGLLAASSYALTSWNVGAVWSGAANINLATGQPVGDGLARTEDILGGMASTAGVAAGGLGAFSLTTLPDAEGTMATQEGLIGISEHLTQLPGGGGIDPANAAMYSRLTTALENGHALTGTDAAFYQHELLESSLMDSGMGARAAHLETLGQQGIPYAPGYEAQLYHPTVIQQFPTSFSPAAQAAAGVH